jgi:hypothetical protein
MPSLIRREFVAASVVAMAGQAFPECSFDRIGTPYKIGKLVLSASGQEGAFDKVSVDCPFVFRHDGQFYMTFVAFDGNGYQTGLASSPDLVSWKKEGAILRRDPSLARIALQHRHELDHARKRPLLSRRVEEGVRPLCWCVSRLSEPRLRTGRGGHRAVPQQGFTKLEGRAALPQAGGWRRVGTRRTVQAMPAGTPWKLLHLL